MKETGANKAGPTSLILFAVFQISAATALTILTLIAYLSSQTDFYQMPPAIPIIMLPVEGAAATLALLALSRSRHYPGEWVLIGLFRVAIGLQLPFIPWIYTGPLPPPPRATNLLTQGLMIEPAIGVITLLWLLWLHAIRSRVPTPA